MNAKNVTGAQSFMKTTEIKKTMETLFDWFIEATIIAQRTLSI